MESNYSIRKKAEQDLDDILSYIAEDNPKSALALYETFLKQFESLSLFPEMGKLREEFNPVVRSLPVGNYIIFFDGKHPVEIIRVLHGARDLAEALEDL